MSYTTTITKKGQITIPKDLRENLGVKAYDKLAIEPEDKSLRISPLQDILDLAGTFKPKKKVSVLQARKDLKNKYERV